MSAPVIALFNSKARAGRTALVYHLSWMYVELGLRVLVADLDPQAHLTATFLDDERLEELWPHGDHPSTLLGCLQPLVQEFGDIGEVHLEHVELDQIRLDGQPSVFKSPLALLPGDPFLSIFEDNFAEAWLKCLDQDEHSFRVMSAFWRIIQRAATEHKADVVLIDVGSNLAAINRAALIAADFVVVPLSPNLFSLQGLRNLGPTLRKWREGWKDRIIRGVMDERSLPVGEMSPVGYIFLDQAVLVTHLLQYSEWRIRIPMAYREEILNEAANSTIIPVRNDPYCIAYLQHYYGLMSLAQEAHKPMFSLKPGDGATGVYTKAVQGAYSDFRSLAQEIARQTNIPLPPRPY